MQFVVHSARLPINTLLAVLPLVLPELMTISRPRTGSRQTPVLTLHRKLILVVRTFIIREVCTCHLHIFVLIGYQPIRQSQSLFCQLVCGAITLLVESSHSMPASAYFLSWPPMFLQSYSRTVRKSYRVVFLATELLKNSWPVCWIKVQEGWVLRVVLVLLELLRILLSAFVNPDLSQFPSYSDKIKCPSHHF